MTSSSVEPLRPAKNQSARGGAGVAAPAPATEKLSPSGLRTDSAHLSDEGDFFPMMSSH